jgi:hypothetical protein
MELRTKLDEKLTEKFRVVKEHIGLKANKNVMAFLIYQAYNKIRETRYRKLFMEPETYDRAEKNAATQGVTVDIYVTELVEKKLKEGEEGVKHGN